MRSPATSSSPCTGVTLEGITAQLTIFFSTELLKLSAQRPIGQEASGWRSGVKAAWALIPIALTVAVAYALPPAARVPVVAAGAVVAGALVAWLVVRPLARAAHRADARAAAVVAQAMDGILAFDGDGKVGAFNRAAERLFGMRADQVIGTDVARLLPDEAFGYYWRGLVAKASTRTTPGVLLPVRALRADGSAVPLEGTFAAYRDGSRVVVTGV